MTLYTARIVYLVSPRPIVSFTSRRFCESVRFIGLFHLGGTYMWGTCIALFRVLFVTSQDFLMEKIGIGKLLILMVDAGISEVSAV